MRAAVEGRNIDFAPNNIPGMAAMQKWFGTQESFSRLQRNYYDRITKEAKEEAERRHESEVDKTLRQVLQN